MWERLEPDAVENDAGAVPQHDTEEAEEGVNAADVTVQSLNVTKRYKIPEPRSHKALLRAALQQHLAVASRRGEVALPKKVSGLQKRVLTPLQRAQNDC